MAMSDAIRDSKKIDQKDLRRVYNRWLFASQTGWNYERMQGLSFCYAIMPVLRKIYDTEEELKKATKRHLQFFNSQRDMGNLILGATVAIEESQEEGAEEAATAIKTGLMGPLAGIGDSIFNAIGPTVFASIAAYMALNGSSVGIWLWFLWNVVRWFIRWQFTKLGYNQGVRLVTVMEGTLQRITEAASILGLTVIGALIPTVVTPTVPLVFETGEVAMEVQDVLDQIMPALIPALIVFFVYWLLGRERMNSTRVIWILLVISIVLGAFGILA